MICNISGLPLVNAALNGTLACDDAFVWVDEALSRLISLAIVRINVFGFELAISNIELLAIRHMSAMGANGRFSVSLLSKMRINLNVFFYLV
jgi:hypothetical protein